MDAIRNDLAGRRSFEETAELWTTNPVGMYYAAVQRTGITGWMSRPMSIADGAGFGIGPMLGNDVSSMQAAQAINIMGILGGPLGAVLNDFAKGVLPMLNDTNMSPRSWHSIRKAVPYQNLLWTDLVHRFTRAMGVENPFGEGEGFDPFITRPAVDATRGQGEPRP